MEKRYIIVLKMHVMKNFEVIRGEFCSELGKVIICLRVFRVLIVI